MGCRGEMGRKEGWRYRCSSGVEDREGGNGDVRLMLVVVEGDGM